MMGETMQPLERETQQVRKDGSRVTAEIGLYPVVVEHGRFFAVTIVRRLHEDTRVDRLRDEFCDLVSSSLKTPLTAIVGFTQLLGRSEIVEDRLRRARVLDSLRAQTAVLGTIIDDLLLVAEVRQGELRLDRAPMDLVALVIECVAEAERAHPGCRFVVDVEGRVPGVRADAQRLRQALSHLLGNAATHSPIDGSIGVTVSRDHADGEIAVRDAGEGIPPEDLPRVFERFVRGSRARGAGAGVGLYLVRLIAEAHGGSVELDSGPGQGCTAILRLPLE
jgi:signal transduction histidine kinase